VPKVELAIPEIQGTDTEKLAGVVYQVVEILNYLLNNLDGGNVAPGGIPATKIYDFGGETIRMLKAEVSKMTAGSVEAQYLSAAVSELAMTRIKMAKIDIAQITDLTVEIIRAVVANIDEVNSGSVATNELYSQIIMAVTGEIRQVVAGSVTTNELTTIILEAVEANLELVIAGEITAEVLKAIKADIETLEAGELYAAILEVVLADANMMSAGRLYAALAEISKAEIAVAEIDMARIKDLIAGDFLFSRGSGGEVYIANLKVSEGSFISVTSGELVLKGADGAFYTVLVLEDGSIRTEPKQIENVNIDDSSISGVKIIENSILAAQLNVTEIFANEALINVIKAVNIDAGSLFASEAFITELKTHLISSDYLSVVIAGMPDIINNLGMYFEFTPGGLIIREPGSEFMQIISGEEAAFYQGGRKTAYFANSRMYAPNIIVEETLSLGDFHFVVEQNGGLSLKYGGAEV